MEEIIISVITTVKNGQTYILETLESVKNQTFKKFEHIIVDDGSTDSTLSILKIFQKKNPEYKMIILEPGQIGRGKALNLAVSKSNGKWIAIIDADDIWHPEKLAIQYRVIGENNVDVLATATNLFRDISSIKKDEITVEEYTLSFYSINDLLKSNTLSHSSVLIRKDICKYNEGLKSQFDYELWLRLAKQKKKLSKVNLNLNNHRIHKNQSFESKMKKAYNWRAFKLKVRFISLDNFQLFFFI